MGIMRNLFASLTFGGKRVIITTVGHRPMYIIFAGMAELADAPDLGSGVPDVQVQVLSPAPTTKPTHTGGFCCSCE